MKALFIFSLLMVLTSILAGAPLRNISTQITQPDGTSLAIRMSGDEYYHRLHDKDGYTIMQNPQDGWYVYADKKAGDLVPGTAKVGVATPSSLRIAPNLMPDKDILRQRFERMRGNTRSTYGKSPTTGSVNNICIFVRFSDQVEFTDAYSFYNNMYNSSTGVSMKGFFLEESNSQLSVSTTFYPMQPGPNVISYQDSNPRGYYMPFSVTNPLGYQPGPPLDPHANGYLRLHQMMVNAVNFIAPMVPMGLNLDADNDGSVDNISFVCQGAADGNGILWPHYWVLDAYPVTPLAYINGKQADDYNFEPQWNDPSLGGGGIDAAVISHEFSHTLGFPDLYHYSFDGLDPCGWWDLMDYCQSIPQHHLAYMKWKYGGWFAGAPSLPSVGPCSLNAISASFPFDCYMYQMPTGERIWIEYRRNIGTYESRLPGSGLIFYRIDPSISPWGNAGGAPDEVYVYRPFASGGTLNGNINWAHMAWEQVYTAINQYTDPAPWSQASPGMIANLNIHSIGSNTGPVMTFEVSTQIPVIWTGAVSNNWFTPGNWTTGAIPVSTDFVIIQQGSWNCNIPPNASPAVCGYIRVEYQFNLLPVSSLVVSGGLYSIGRITNDANLLQINGNMIIDYWYAGSQLLCQSNPNAVIKVGADCRFENSTTVSLMTGTLEFFTPGGIAVPVNNTFTLNSFSTVLNHVTINRPLRTVDYNSLIVMSPPITLLGNLNINSGSTLLISSPQEINLDGNLAVQTTGNLQAILGTMTLTGNAGPQSVSIQNPVSYLNNLKINNGTGINLNLLSNLNIYGNLEIVQGVMAANANTIYLHGNWSNQANLGAFQKGTSRVVFNGSADQNISVGGPSGNRIEDFYVLELAKPSNFLTVNSAGLVIMCDFYDYTSGNLKVTDGSFTAWNLLDYRIKGNFTCNLTGIINLYDTSGACDLDAALDIQGGTFNVYNNGTDSNWGMYPCSLNMNSGLLRFHNCGVFIQSGTGFTSTISGGTIHVNGGFRVQNTGFTPSGGLIIVDGSNASMIETAVGSSFYDVQAFNSNLSTNSQVRIANDMIIESACTLSISNTVRIAATLTINGTAQVYQPGLLSGANIDINGTLTLNPGSILETNNNINIGTTGLLQNLGTTSNPVIMRGITGRGYWKMHVMGILDAVHTVFMNTREEGIWIMSTGQIDPNCHLTSCAFSNGQSGSTAYLTLANNQTLTLDDLLFNSPGGITYNISKTGTSGTVTVNHSTGDFAGESFENDPYGLIDWVSANPNIQVSSFYASESNPYIADQVNYSVTITNTTSNPITGSFNLHLFKNRATLPGPAETGDFIISVMGLGGNETVTHTFTGIFSMTAENWTSWVLVDPEQAIVESDETDNNGMTTLTWNNLPAIPDITLTYSGNNIAVLDWDYPIWVNEFHVYECNIPNGSFTNLIGTTTESNLDITTDGSIHFYQVRAVRSAPRD